MIKWKGIRFNLHPLFLLVMLASVATGRFAEIAALFAIVLFHELGHLAAALRFGWTVREIKLLPFGGVMEVEDAGAIPVREEALVALAGPLQNVIMAAAAWLCGWAGWTDPLWTEDMVTANALIALFNLLPILPLDGGKMLQAGMSLLFPYHLALRLCVRTSMALSAGVAALSAAPLLFGRPIQLNALAIACFLIFSNWMYGRHIPFLFLRFLLHRARRSEAKIDKGTLAQPIVIGEEKPVAAAIRLLMKEKYHLIYVMSRGKIKQVVPEARLIDGFVGRLTGGHADFRFFM